MYTIKTTPHYRAETGLDRIFVAGLPYDYAVFSVKEAGSTANGNQLDPLPHVLRITSDGVTMEDQAFLSLPIKVRTQFAVLIKRNYIEIRHDGTLQAENDILV